MIQVYETDKAHITKMMDDLQVEPGCRDLASYYILPNAFSNFDVSHGAAVLTQDAITNLKTGVELMVVYGKVTYRTPTGDKHWSTFCNLYVPSVNLFHACKYGTDAE